MKRIGLLVILLLSCSTLIAQSRFRTTYISVGGGVQSYAGELYKDLGPKGTFTPTVNASVGHWVSRIFAIQAHYDGWSAKGFDSAGSTNPYADGVKDNDHIKLEFNYFNAHADLVFDFLRAIKHDRNSFYDMFPYVGAGYARSSKSGSSVDSWSVNAGLINAFRLSKRFDFNIGLQASMFKDNFNHIDTGMSFDLMLSATAGITYKFCL